MLVAYFVHRYAKSMAAEAAAIRIANDAVREATLRVELDFKPTLTDMELRAATL
jgi:hypothetical protein